MTPRPDDETLEEPETSSSLSYRVRHYATCETMNSRLSTVALQRIRYIFLDRDGVINQKAPEGEYVADWSEFQIIPGTESAIRALNRSGRCVLVVTNQRGIALGLYTAVEVESLHARFQKHLESRGAKIDAFYYCPHDLNQCDCRKPKTGMLETAFRDFPGASPKNSLMIGDSISDIEAARACGMLSIFVRGDPRSQKPGAVRAAELADSVVDSLSEVVDRFFKR